MNYWKAVLLVYREIDVEITDSSSDRMKFSHGLTQREVMDAVQSFYQFPALVEQLTDGLAGVRAEVVLASEVLSSLTPLGEGLYWPSPDDTRRELQQHVSGGKHDSVFVFWPQSNSRTGDSIPSGGWGLGMTSSAWSLGATYATVANAESWVWEIPLKGEVWLHEWLHGVCPQFAARGYEMPDGDADGGDRHGYVQCPEAGWTEYYQDLMTGKVEEAGRFKGIPLQAWTELP